MRLYDWILGKWGADGRDNAGDSSRRFPRRYQSDDYSCGPRTAQMVLDYYERRMSFRAIKSELGTDEDGTSMAPMARLFREQGLSVTTYPGMNFRDLERCLRRGIVVVQVDGDHVAAVHDLDDRHVYISDPSVVRLRGGRQIRASFRARWDRWGMVVSDRVNGRPTPPRFVPLEVECLATGALVEVESADGEYTCPDCGEDVTVESLEAEHAEIDTYECPMTGRVASVPHEVTDEDEYFECPACAEPVMLQEIGGRVHLLHGLEYE